MLRLDAAYLIHILLLAIIFSMEKHGFLKRGVKLPSIYSTWTGMRYRCRNPKGLEYHNYGGRGITVCERWNKFTNFYKDMGDKPAGMMLERIDNNKGYFPENCRWATLLEQNNNQRKTRFLELNGERLSVSAWARKLKIHRAVLFSRIRLGYPDHMVLDTKADYRIGNKCVLDLMGIGRQRTQAKRIA